MGPRLLLAIAWRHGRFVLVLGALLSSGCASFPRVSAPPLPPPAGGQFITGKGNVRLFTAIDGEPRDRAPRGIVWYVLGPEISSAPLYPRFTSAIHEAGFATAVVHSRGTGYSDGLRGDSDEYTLFLGDARQALESLAARFPALPLFVFGHSAGAALALEAAATAKVPLAGVLIVNPAYRLIISEGMGPSLGDYLVYSVNLLFRSSALTVDMNRNPSAVKNPFDRAEAEQMQKDPLVVRYFSMRYLLAQRDVMNRCPENAAHIAAPFLLLEGALDALVDPRGSDEILAAVKGSDVTRLRAPEGAHGSSAVETMVGPLLEWIIARAGEH